jgi:hypothetical protein
MLYKLLKRKRGIHLTQAVAKYEAFRRAVTSARAGPRV